MCDRSDVRPTAPIDALWEWEKDTVHSRQLLWEAYLAVRKADESWDEVVFPSGTFEAHPVEIVLQAAMHIERVAREQMRMAKAWQERYHAYEGPDAVPDGERR